MSYEAAVAWSILRSLLAGALCWGLARVLRGSLQQSAVSSQSVQAHRLQPVDLPLNAQRSPGGPRLRIGLLLVPFFMPGLVVGYAYRNASLSLVQTPLLNELLYLAIVVAQLTPVVVLALEWLPAAALGPSGTFLLKLAEQTGRRAPVGERLRAILAGELPRQLTAAAIAALLCFQEVEVATLMQARGWAEWIFTKQAGGVELVEVLPFLVGPVGYGLLLTVPVLGYWTWDRLPACHARGTHHGGTETRRARVSGTALAAGSSSLPRTEEPAASAWPLTETTAPGSRTTAVNLSAGGPRWRVGLGVIWIAVSWLLVVIWPVGSLAIGAFRGRGLIRFRSALWQEIGDSLVLGVTVTLGLWLILWSVDQLGRRGPGRQGPGGRGSRRAAIVGRLSRWFSPLCPLSPTAESSVQSELIAGERGPESGERQSGFQLAARQEPRPPEPCHPAHSASVSVGDRLRPMSPDLVRERPAGTGRNAHPTVVWRVAVVMLLLPGLLGSLALGLTIFEICQRIGIQPSYSPVPLVVGMVLFLLPRALAMQAMLLRNEQQAGVFLAESLAAQSGERGRQGAAILWRIRDAGRFWTLALLFWWSYLELTLPALLRPAGMAPAPLRLYNFLHYGHIPGLAAMLLVVLLVPVLLLTVGKGFWMRMDGLSTEER